MSGTDNKNNIFFFLLKMNTVPYIQFDSIYCKVHCEVQHFKDLGWCCDSDLGYMSGIHTSKIVLTAH